MHFKKLEFVDYKVYYGKQSLDLEIPQNQKTTYRKNIVLIGGLNGTGKTTILEAFQIALFARRGKTENQYKQMLDGAINDQAFAEGKRNCSISVSMENKGENNSSETITIVVKMQYNNQKKCVNIERTIYIFNQKSQIERESSLSDGEFNEFINQRIPLEVAPYFIFDGEKIQSLTETQETGELKQAIQQISSLEIYKKLVDDLDNIRRETTNELNRILEQKEDTNELSKNITKKMRENSKLESKTRQIREQIEFRKGRVQYLKNQLRSMNAKNEKSKAKINKRLGQLEESLKQVEEQIDHFTKNDILQILLSPKITELQKRLREEKKYQEKKLLHKTRFDIYEKFMDQFLKELKISFHPPFNTNEIANLKAAGEKAWAKINNINESTEVERFEIIHDLSNRDLDKILAIRPHKNTNIKKLLDKRRTLLEEQKMLEQVYKEAPEHIDTSSITKEIDQHIKKLGELENENRKIRLERARLEKEIKSSRALLKRQEDMESEEAILHNRLDYITKLQSAANEFVKETTCQKAANIRKNFHDILQQLVRKGSDFFAAEFDETTYQFKIYDEEGNQLKLKDRSAGEKQIIALSFIWALTKSSRLPLPFVMDTPLGRLDSIHRENLAKNFFNQLSDQVIILSTDTEISAEFSKLLDKYIAHRYLLDYEQHSTTIKRGYFE